MAFIQKRTARRVRNKNNYNSRGQLKSRRHLLSQLPGNELNKHEFEHMLGQSYIKSNQINSVKDLSTNLQNIFQLNRNKTEFDCRYYSEQKFNEKHSKLHENLNLSIFNFNIRSLSKNHEQLKIFLNQLTVKFDLITLCETWSTNMTFLKNIFKGYKCKYVPPKSSKCGGIALFYRENYKVEILQDLNINSSPHDIIDVDELWVSIETEWY